MPQTTERIRKLQEAMKASSLSALLLEPGPAMVYLTGVRWGRSERTFALIIPLNGEPAWVLPAFEEGRARELIPAGADIRVWQEDESPFAKIAAAFRDHGISGRLGIEDTVRFFVFDGIRRETPSLIYVSAAEALRSLTLGVDVKDPAAGPVRK